MSTLPKNKRQSLLGQARGLGSGHNGTYHYWSMRVSSVVMVILGFTAVALLINAAVFGGYSQTTNLLQSPLFSAMIVVFLGLANYHGTKGLQTVFEDYIHTASKRNAFIIGSYVISAVFFVIGVMAIIQIHFSGMIPHVN